MQIETEKSFWLVWREGLNGNPRVKHPSFAEAREEAVRLAKLYDGDFYVMRAISKSGKTVVQTTILEE